jgi:hypothetical protein
LIIGPSPAIATPLVAASTRFYLLQRLDSLRRLLPSLPNEVHADERLVLIADAVAPRQLLGHGLLARPVFLDVLVALAGFPQRRGCAAFVARQITLKDQSPGEDGTAFILEVLEQPPHAIQLSGQGIETPQRIAKPLIIVGIEGCR